MNIELRKEDETAARALAHAMRQGLEHRLGWATDRSAGRALPPDLRHRLESSADLAALPALSRPRYTAALVRAVRRALRAFLRPWWSVQTEFNGAVVAALDAIYLELARLAPEKLPAIAPPWLGEAVESPTGSAEALKWAFTLSQLPPPPARLLSAPMESPRGTEDFSILGYEVITLQPTPPALRASHLAVGGLPGHLPFRDDTFDAVLSSLPAGKGAVPVETRQVVGEVHRVLRPAGVWIACVNSGSGLPTLTEWEEFLQSFHRVERAYAHLEAGTWHLNHAAPAGFTTTGAAMALLAAQHSPCSC